MSVDRSDLCRKNYHIFSLLMFTILIIITIFENVLLQIFAINPIFVVLDNNNQTTVIINSTNYNKDLLAMYLNKFCTDNEVTYYLYTRKNINMGQKICVNNTYSNLNETYFDSQQPIKIIIHGYNSDMHLDSLIDIRNEYLDNNNYNVIAVDWHRLAAPPYYPNAVYHVSYVGKCLAQLIKHLRDINKCQDIHIIGFSLGAHVPAFAANILKPYKVARITGLDPAMPFFITVSKDKKLDSSDAEFVDVLHTNAFVQGQFAMSGHIDFYMNGGIYQPGCWTHDNPFTCNHHRAIEYYAESINSKSGFWGWPCTGMLGYLLDLCPPRFPAIRAGDHVDKHYKGFYLVKTKAEKPFADGLLPFNTVDVE